VRRRNGRGFTFLDLVVVLALLALLVYVVRLDWPRLAQAPAGRVAAP
jgi:Tfp pilus assembly protein FimT